MQALLDLFERLSEQLSKLTELANEKIKVVKQDDLLGLDEVLKQEQAIALNIRGLDQKRTELLKELNLADIPLLSIPERCPAELKVRAKKTVENLKSSYKLYQSAAEVARNTLEINLHEVEKFLESEGAGRQTGAGYRSDDELEPPAPMKTDFRV